MNFRKCLVALAVLVAVFALGGAGIAAASHSWGSYHWARTSNSFTIKVVDSVTSSWGTPLSTAVLDWSASSVLNAVNEAGSDSWTARFNCSMPKGKIRACNYSYGNTGWLGIAQIVVNSTNHITKGRVAVNDTYFNLSTYNNPNERLHVMCQEIGHALGLDHQSEDGSSLNTCMDYFSNTGANALSTLSTHPNQHDYDQLVTIYTHLDDTNTVLSSTSGGSRGKSVGVGQDIDPANQSAWGRAVRQDARGNNSLYERNLGNGEKLVTFITWAE